MRKAIVALALALALGACASDKYGAAPMPTGPLTPANEDPVITAPQPAPKAAVQPSEFRTSVLYQ
jgi:hypothetical protein